MHEKLTGMSTPTQRLGDLVKARRESLGIYTISEAASRAGLSRETWTNVEKGEPVKPVTFRKVEDALQWNHGSCGAILAGGEPTPVATDPPPPTPAATAPTGRDELAHVEQLLRDAMAELERLQQQRRTS